jgi:uncharacterized protein (TIGR03435 family)
MTRRTAMRRIALAVLALAVAPCAFAQAPAFDVATVRVATTGSPDKGAWSAPNVGKFEASSLTLTWLIRLAYDVNADQILNKPAWLDTEVYDVEARPEAGVKLSREELRPRLQALLAERLHLAIHRETRDAPGYVMVVAKGGAKLTPTKGDHWANFQKNVSSGRIEGSNWSMPFLAQKLSEQTHQPVANRTGLVGSYDVALRYAGEDEADLSLPSLFTVLRESLGLELKAQKVPVEMVVIDHVDRVPTEN